MLSPVEMERAVRGAQFKRIVRSAAASRDIFEDVELAEALEVSRNSVQAWWRGASPSVPTLRRIAAVTGLDLDYLTEAAYPSAAASAEDAAAVQRLADATPSPRRQSRQTGGTGSR